MSRKLFRTGAGQTTALAGVSLRIEEGEFVVVMGPSGCGKSMLLNLLGLLDNPSRGEYYLLGRSEATSISLSHLSQSFSETHFLSLSKSSSGNASIAFSISSTLVIDILRAGGLQCPLPAGAYPDRPAQPAGEHRVVWDGLDEGGRPAASGIYFYRLTAAEYTRTRRLALVR